MVNRGVEVDEVTDLDGHDDADLVERHQRGLDKWTRVGGSEQFADARTGRRPHCGSGSHERVQRRCGEEVGRQ